MSLGTIWANRTRRESLEMRHCTTNTSYSVSNDIDVSFTVWSPREGGICHLVNRKRRDKLIDISVWFTKTKYKTILLLSCVHNFKSDWFNNMDHMHILDHRPSVAPLHTLFKLYDASVGFVTPPALLRIYISLFAVTEGLLLLDIGWFVLFLSQMN